MVLHLQRSPQRWHLVDVGPGSFKKKTPWFEQIRQILVQEKNHRSKQRKAAGFFLTLTEAEEAELFEKIKKFYGPFVGEIDAAGALKLLTKMVEGQPNFKIKVSYFTRNSKKKGWQPSFTFIDATSL